MKLYAGFDGGGSKTACCLADETGRLLGIGTGGPSNYLFCGRETAAQSVQNGLNAAFAAAGIAPQPLAGTFVGSAAILLGNGDYHADFFRSCIDSHVLVCDSDIVPVWFGGAQEQDAVVAIAGTGSIAYGCTKEGFFRVGGWGPLLGDEGSGYDLGRRALQLAARMADGREPLEKLFLKEILRFYRIDTPHDLISAVKGENFREKIAACAKIITLLDQQGSPAAALLLEQTADELALLCTVAARKSGREELPVVLSGGLAETILPRMRKRLSDVRLLTAQPCVACAALALHQAGQQAAACRLLKAGALC